MRDLEEFRPLVAEAGRAFAADYRYAEAIARIAHRLGQPESAETEPTPGSPRGSGQRFTRAERAERIARAVAMHADGETTAAIADALGCSPETVNAYLRRARADALEGQDA